jgi:hypothetical protein
MSNTTTTASSATTTNPSTSSSTSTSSTTTTTTTSKLFRVFPRRTIEESAVIEWGNSAIISAIDASVAAFGPQTNHAALFEVETKPVFADPVNGMFLDDDDDNNNVVDHVDVADDGNNDVDEYEEEEQEEEDSINDNVNNEGEEGDQKKIESKHPKRKRKGISKNTTTATLIPPQTRIRPFRNAQELRGNVAVVTNTGDKTEIELVQMALLCHAAAVMIINIDEYHPDDIFQLHPITLEEEEIVQQIDIPVVMISLNSANAITSATVTPEMKEEDIVNDGTLTLAPFVGTILCVLWFVDKIFLWSTFSSDKFFSLLLK